MKKTVKIIMVWIIAISILCSASLSVWAISATSGRGIVDDEVYFIVNTEGEYLKPEAQTSYDTSSTSVITDNGTIDHTEPRYMWKVEKQSDGTFIIKSFNGRGKYLTVCSDNSVKLIESDSTSVNDSMKFDICRNDDTDSYQGMYKILNGNKHLSCYSVQGTTAHMEAKTTYWTLMAVEQGNVDYYGYSYSDNDNDNGFDTTIGSADLIDVFDDWGYPMSYVGTNETSAENMLFYMTENDISIYAGLGDSGVLILDPNSDESGSMIMADYELTDGPFQEYVNDLSENALASSRCILYLSSYSGCDAVGNDYELYNLVNETFEKGAHYVLGFVCEISDDNVLNWLEDFMNGISLGYTINDAVKDANDENGFYHGDGDDRVYSGYVYSRGDGNQYLNF